MPVFKNESNNTWYVMARYVNWKGERKQKCKRGFSTKREAQEWERTFQQQNAADMDMSFEAFTQLYEKDIRPRLKENTWQTKENIIEGKIIPYFKDRKLCDISATDVIEWQNEIRTLKNKHGSYIPRRISVPFTISSALCSITLCDTTACVPILRLLPGIWAQRRARR